MIDARKLQHDGPAATLVGRLIGRHEIKARFILVGIWNTILGYGIFVGLDSLFALLFSKRYVAYMSAIVPANILSTTNAFIFHKYITFKSRAKGKTMALEFLKFCTTYLFSFLISLTALPFSVEVFRFHPKTAGALTVPIVTIVSYLGHSRFSFRNKAGSITTRS